MRQEASSQTLETLVVGRSENVVDKSKRGTSFQCLVLLSHSRSSEVANTKGNPDHHITRIKCTQKNSTYLDELVPASGDNDGVLGVGREAHA
jgi:hypothetical protein